MIIILVHSIQTNTHMMRIRSLVGVQIILLFFRILFMKKPFVDLFKHHESLIGKKVSVVSKDTVSSGILKVSIRLFME